MSKILTLTGVSAAGKTSIARTLIERFPNVRMVTSYSTRDARPDDIPGEYTHVSEEGFLKLYSEFQWAGPYYKFRYGTRTEDIQSVLKSKQEMVGVMILFPRAVKKLQTYLRRVGQLDVHIPVFVRAPTPIVLRERMRNRGMSPQEMQRRTAESSSWERDARRPRAPKYTFIENRQHELKKAVETVSRLLF